jgi:hypothetical protein
VRSLFLFAWLALGAEGGEEDGTLWTDEWGGTQTSDPSTNPLLQGPRAPTPVVPLGGMGPTLTELRGNTYNHTVRVYEGGWVVCEGSTGLEPKDTPGAAAEVAMWSARECLRMRYYSMGLGHEEVRARMATVLSMESCRLEKSRDDRTTHFEYKSTLTCIAPVQKK